MLRRASWILVFLLALPLHAAGPEPGIAALRAQVEESGIPAVGLALVRPGRPAMVEGFGSADPESGRPFTDRTPFPVLSMTKLLLALATLRLAEAGRIDLVDPVSRHLGRPVVGNPWEATHPVRVVHLLEHTGGLGDFDFREVVVGPGREPPDLEEIVTRSLVGRPLRWPPGTRPGYSNPGYALLARVISAAAGRPWEQVVVEDVARPLDLSSLRLDCREDCREELPWGEAGDPPAPVAWRRPWFAPSAGAVLDLRDLAKLLTMLAGGGLAQGTPFLSAASLHRLETPETGQGARHGYRLGFGKGIARVGRSGRSLVESRGGGYAFSALLRYLPGSGSGYVLLATSSSHGRILRNLEGRLDELSFGQESVATRSRPGPAAAVTGPEDLSVHAGWYQRVNPRHERLALLDAGRGTCRVEAAAGGLVFLRPGRQPRLLFSSGGGGFREPGDPPGSDCILFLPGPGGPEHPSGTFVEASEEFRRVALPWGLFLEAMLLVALLLAPLGMLLPVWAQVAGRGLPGREVSTSAASWAGAVLVLGLLAARSLPVERLGTPVAAAVLLRGLTAIYPALALGASLAGVTGCLRSPDLPLARVGMAVGLAHGALAILLMASGLVAITTW